MIILFPKKMKKNIITLSQNNLPKNSYSKQLTKYDCELTFNRLLNYVIRQHKKSDIFKSKELKNIFNQKTNNINKHFNSIKSRINISEKKLKLESLSPINEFTKQKRISYLPKISPYILSNKTSILIDYNKASEMGAEGFKTFCDNENKNIKDILFAYNDHNFKSLKDFNSFSYFNKVNDNFGFIKEEKNNNTTNNKEIQEDNVDKNNYNYNYFKNSIFDDLTKRNKMSKIRKKLLNKIERIKNENKKVIQIYTQNKQSYNKRKNDNRIYRINYSSIEKHTPYTNLNSKSQRLSPEDMVHNIISVYHKKYFSKDNEIKTKENKFNKKNKFFLTNRNINLCSGKYNFSV